MILPLSVQDFNAITSAKEFGYADEWNLDMLLSAQKNGNFYGFKCVEDGEVLGYLHYSTSLDGLDVNSVFVFPMHRKKGVGKTLLLAVLEKAKEIKAEKIFLEVREGNAPAIALYQKLGFNVISERKNYYSGGENAKIMLKENLL